MNKQKLFFSYSRADGSAFAQKLAVDLQKRNFDVWIDQEDIKAGLKWDTEVEKALESCDCLLYLETERSVVSNNVLDEVYYALEQNKKVIPLIVVDSKTPFRLKRLHHIDFTKDYEKGLALLVNELEGRSQTTSSLTAETTTQPVPDKSFLSKKAAVFVLIGSVTVLLAILFLFTGKNENTAAGETTGPVVLADTKTATAHAEHAPESTTVFTEIEQDEKSPTTSTPLSRPGKEKQNKTTSVTQERVSTNAASSFNTRTEKSSDILVENVAGNWRLTGTDAKATSHRGYLKIEALAGNKATIKSYLQFYYPDSDASSYLTVFNAFAGCATCTAKKETKLAVEDIAVGSRTIKKQKEDEPGGRKAGEVISDVNANKSLRGTATLQFIDNNNAVLKIKQPASVSLSDELTLAPFVYTFRFRKND